MTVTYQGINLNCGDRIERSVTVPECWDVTVDHNPSGNNQIEVETPGAAPDQDRNIQPDRMFPGGMVGNFKGRMGPKATAENIVACVASSSFHEALECVRVRGKQVAIPHPKPYSTEGEMWDWLRDRMLDTLKEYQERFGTP